MVSHTNPFPPPPPALLPCEARAQEAGPTLTVGPARDKRGGCFAGVVFIQDRFFNFRCILLRRYNIKNIKIILKIKIMTFF